MTTWNDVKKELTSISPKDMSTIEGLAISTCPKD